MRGCGCCASAQPLGSSASSPSPAPTEGSMIAAFRCLLLAALGASTASCLLPDGSVDVYGGVTNINDQELRDVDKPTHYGTVAAVALDGGLVGMGIEAGYQKA